jgi:hypothetical protein
VVEIRGRWLASPDLCGPSAFVGGAKSLRPRICVSRRGFTIGSPQSRSDRVSVRSAKNRRASAALRFRSGFGE